MSLLGAKLPKQRPRTEAGYIKSQSAESYSRNQDSYMFPAGTEMFVKSWG
jgi:hypothetical protein